MSPKKILTVDWIKSVFRKHFPSKNASNQNPTAAGPAPAATNQAATTPTVGSNATQPQVLLRFHFSRLRGFHVRVTEDQASVRRRQAIAIRHQDRYNECVRALEHRGLLLGSLYNSFVLTIARLEVILEEPTIVYVSGMTLQQLHRKLWNAKTEMKNVKKALENVIKAYADSMAVLNVRYEAIKKFPNCDELPPNLFINATRADADRTLRDARAIKYTLERCERLVKERAEPILIAFKEIIEDMTIRDPWNHTEDGMTNLRRERLYNRSVDNEYKPNVNLDDPWSYTATDLSQDQE